MTSPKEDVWLSEYFKCWNATEAARRADYKWPNKIGPEKLKKFADEIKERLDEKAMKADEVLARLANHARGSMEDFMRIVDGKPHFDFEKAEEAHKLDLIKKLKVRKKTYTEGRGGNGDPVTETKVEVDLYDAQSALQLIGRHHGLFKDKVEHDVSGSLTVTADDIAKARAAAKDFENQKLNSDESGAEG